ncbi:MAG TPA: sulfatase [Candidatus Krumholzibacteria bacterium]
MTRVRRLCLLGALLLLLLPSAASARKNLLLIAIDTLRADHLGCYGHDRATSPSIDILATDGLRFETAIATAPWTLPSFAGIFTGRHGIRHGAGLFGETRDLSSQRPRPISTAVPTLAESLRAAGYHSGAVTSNPYLLFGIQRGFTSFVCKSMGADRVGALSRAWLTQQDGDEPFFLFVHFNDPHEPTNSANVFLRELGHGPELLGDPRRGALERWGEGEHYLGHVDDEAALAGALELKKALYDAAILHVDHEVAGIVRALERRGLRDDTLIVILSDHGEEFLDHAAVERGRGEDPRQIWGIGHGHSLYQELLRVPLILSGPGVQARVIDEAFSLVDLMPTLLSYLEVPLPPGMDGVDRLAWIADPRRSSPPILADSIAYGPALWSYFDGDFKLIGDDAGRARELFRWRGDRAERDNLLPQDWVEAMKARVLALRDTLAADAPLPETAGELSPEALEGLRALGYVK